MTNANIPQNASVNYTGILPPAPPGFSYTAAGTLVAVRPASSLLGDHLQKKKFLLVFPYWAGDIERIDALAMLVANLERVFNPDVDILFFGRKDAPVGPQQGTIDALRRRFGNVFHLCGQSEGAGNYEVGFPWGANGVWQDLAERMAQSPWVGNYRCFLNLEWDCVPTRPGWLAELAHEWDAAAREGRYIVGTYQQAPAPHYNGVAVYAIDIADRLKLGGRSVPPETAYDIFYGPLIIPMAQNTKLITLDYRRPSISPDELFSSGAALYHGVRDYSAVAAVIDEHINHVPRKAQTFADKTIYTYRARVPGWDEQEIDAQIAAWESGWRSNGWNPVVLGPRTAQRHPRHSEYMARAASFPTVNVREYENACWERWLALAVQGGGIMSDFDVLPVSVAKPWSDVLPKRAGFQVLGGGVPCLVQADEAGCGEWVATVMEYQPPIGKTPKGGPAHISDMIFVQELLAANAKADAAAEPPVPVANPWLSSYNLVRERDAVDFAKSPVAVHFSARSVNIACPGQFKSRAMNGYLVGL